LGGIVTTRGCLTTTIQDYEMDFKREVLAFL
jgi:hypothetical protein